MRWLLFLFRTCGLLVIEPKRLWGLCPIVFGPRTLGRTWGTRPIPFDSVARWTPQPLTLSPRRSPW
jgi:hypothetical protein